VLYLQDGRGSACFTRPFFCILFSAGTRLPLPEASSKMAKYRELAGETRVDRVEVLAATRIGAATVAGYGVHDQHKI